MHTIPEPTEPEYFLTSFPRDAFPAYSWTQRPATLPGDAWTTETTHRDGQQGGLPLSTEQSLRFMISSAASPPIRGPSGRQSFLSTVPRTGLRSLARLSVITAALPSSRQPGYGQQPKMSCSLRAWAFARRGCWLRLRTTTRSISSSLEAETRPRKPTWMP